MSMGRDSDTLHEVESNLSHDISNSSAPSRHHPYLDPTTRDTKDKCNQATDIEKVASDPVIPHDDDNNSDIPGDHNCPDGGFDAWMVVVADFWCCFNTWGFTNSFGVFETYYIANELSHYSPSTIAWIGSVQTFLLFMPSFFVGRLTDAGYVRPMMIYGTIIQVFGLMMTSISKEYYQIFLSQGIVYGLGLCTLFLPAVAVVPHWFKKKRALALGIGAAGSSVGGVIYPIALNKLIPKVGFGWAVRICAFLMLATQMFAIIYCRPRLPPRPLRGAAFFDPTAFKEVIYLLVTAGLFCGFWGLYTPFFYLESFALYHGISSDIAFYTLPIVNASSTFGRILPNFFADKIGCLNMMIPCVSISGILILLWLLCTTSPSLVTFCVLFGFVSGAFVSLPPAVIASISKDPRKIGIRVGQSFSIVSLAALMGTPISGALQVRERGGFWGMAVFAGTVVLSGGVILSCARVMWSRKVLVKV